MKHFKNIRRAASNFAQIALLMIIIPIACAIVGNLSGDGESGRMLLEIAGEIPYFKFLTEVLSQYSQLHVSTFVNNTGTYLAHISQVLNSVESSMFQLLNITLSVSLFNLVWNILKKSKAVRGDCIIFTALGVFVGYIIVALYTIPLMASIFLMLLYIVIDMIFVQEITFSMKELFIKYILSGLKFGLEMIASLYISCLVALFLVLCYCGGAIGTILLMSIGFVIPFLAVLLVKNLCFKTKG